MFSVSNYLYCFLCCLMFLCLLFIFTVMSCFLMFLMSLNCFYWALLFFVLYCFCYVSNVVLTVMYGLIVSIVFCVLLRLWLFRLFLLRLLMLFTVCSDLFTVILWLCVAFGVFVVVRVFINFYCSLLFCTVYLCCF